jgi:hypothetical protein
VSSGPACPSRACAWKRAGLVAPRRSSPSPTWTSLSRWTPAAAPRPEDIAAIAATPDLRKALVWLPPTSLARILSTLGIRACWQQSAGLPGLGERAKVDDVLQAAKLKFDERGAKGAAVTAIAGKGIMATAPRPEPPPLKIVCDHPFLVGVVGRRTGIFLFLGAVL